MVELDNILVDLLLSLGGAPHAHTVILIVVAHDGDPVLVPAFPDFVQVLELYVLGDQL